MFVNALRISSVTPSEKYSVSGSVLRFVKGRTAIDSVPASGATMGLGAIGVDVIVIAAANSAALAKRSSGDFASALKRAASALALASDRAWRTRGTGSVMC